MYDPLFLDEQQREEGLEVYSLSGTPVDCVKLAFDYMLTSQRVDLVISGINHGPNLGGDILYSGTVSCAMEGALLGIPSIAVSLASLHSEYEDFKLAAEFVASLIERLGDYEIPAKTVLNINVPGLEKEDIAGVEVTELGKRMFTDAYEKRVDPRGKVYYWMAGELINEPEDANTDISAVRNNKISVTPITFEMTNVEVMNQLNKALCSGDFCDWFK
jgi:5'-nucleotidase